ncbi:MAG: hypothetical protein CEN89_258 [Candidatus Berkelbacteria bacterium Licking1014_7]|uniref:PRC-barrel domain-containing protein n=1 Tax=Candidatus Berkelbacteria bacterium Licking1014_7 TaxID=2017147 RepID=A0A554LJU3_9BACT|nr:MAG: hypothetical protein CEN89_258 [Candidatus Berkelbacteria bacterium Licking1014_7]
MEQFLYSNLIGLPVASVDGQKKIGFVSRVIVDFSQFEILGFLMKKYIFLPEKFIAFFDIADIEKEAVLIRSEENLSDISEIVRVNAIVKRGFNLIGLSVWTKEGKYLGRVTDFSFEFETQKIKQFYTKVFFWSGKIFSRSKIIKINQKSIIVENNMLASGVAEIA